PKQVVGEADAWTKVVLRRVDERATVPGGLARLSEKPGCGIEDRLVVVDFVRPGEQVVADAEVESQLAIYTPVVLCEIAGFPASSVVIAMEAAHAVGTHKPAQQLGGLKTGERSVARGRRWVSAIVAVVNPEIAFGIIALGPVHVAMKNGAAKFEDVFSFSPAHGVVELLRRLDYQIRASVTDIGHVSVPAADDRITAQQPVRIGIHNPGFSGHRSARTRLLIPVIWARVAVMKFIEYGGAENVRVAGGGLTGMLRVRAAARGHD